MLLFFAGCITPHRLAEATNTSFSGAGNEVFLTTVTNGGQFLITSSGPVMDVKITTPDDNLVANPISESAPYSGPTLVSLNPGEYVITITGANTNYSVTMTGT